MREIFLNLLDQEADQEAEWVKLTKMLLNDPEMMVYLKPEGIHENINHRLKLLKIRKQSSHAKIYGIDETLFRMEHISPDRTLIFFCFRSEKYYIEIYTTVVDSEQMKLVGCVIVDHTKRK